MKFLFGIWTIAVALTVSAVSAYYSIVGLTAIFAAATIPVIVMGSALEVAKITTAIWLHSFWQSAPKLMKLYLTIATIVLMLITSMGIFGFLSKAHIEQASNSSSIYAKIERIDQEILREEATIKDAQAEIESLKIRVTEADTGIQTRIDSQERIIENIRNRLERDIEIQNQIIERNSSRLVSLRNELSQLDQRKRDFDSLQQSGDVRALQVLVGANADGRMGPNTRQKISEYHISLENRRQELLSLIQKEEDLLRNNPENENAKKEITRLQAEANSEIAKAQKAIDSFRNQLVNVTTEDNSDIVANQKKIIDAANKRIDELLQEKFSLEESARSLEAEVGPIKYIAEMIYGETSTELLEKAVRIVIIMLVFVFDPLALVLVIAGISVLKDMKPVDNADVLLHNEDEKLQNIDEQTVETKEKNDSGEKAQAIESSSLSNKDDVTTSTDSTKTTDSNINVGDLKQDKNTNKDPVKESNPAPSKNYLRVNRLPQNKG